MSKRFIFTLILCFACASAAFAEGYYGDINQFIQNNPDGKKYEFAKTFIKALGYLHTNKERSESVLSSENSRDLDAAQKTNAVIDALVSENVNLRIARNFIKKYWTADNGLILKAADLFMRSCDEQTALNNRERALLVPLYEAQKEGSVEDFDFSNFRNQQGLIAAERKESLKKILEASLLVNKVLISSKPDEYGELINLALTERQRKQLITQLNGFVGGNYEGELRQGQSFLEGSIVAIREMLEDESWATLGG